jgi:malate/lactate dehydrogenase
MSTADRRAPVTPEAERHGGRRPVKVVIVGGAGGIGSSLAFNLLRGSQPYDVVIVDTRPNMITSHVMDLHDVVGLGVASGVRGGSAEEALDADIVVITAAVPLRLNTSRSVFLADNAAIVASVVDPLVAAGWPGVLVVMTNPVDPLITWLHRRGGLDPARILGYTVNDQLRFRSGIAAALGVPAREVGAWVVGEHGEGQVPLFDRITVAGKPVQLDTAQRAVAQEYVDNWYVKHVALDSGRTSTWSSGLGGALFVEAILSEDDAPWPASVVLQGQYGVEGVSLGVPVRLGRGGVREVLEWRLTHDQQRAMDLAAERITAMVTDLEAGASRS